MHTKALEEWRCELDLQPPPALAQNERRTKWVVALTAVTMVVEIVAGMWTGSMALLADGWHMASHVGALGLSWMAYVFARRHAKTGSFVFGTGKVYALAGYSSAVLLGVVSVLMVVESVGRVLNPESVAFREALVVAGLGLVVNLVSAWMLRETHAHGEGHDHVDDHVDDHGHEHVHVHGEGEGRDHNLAAAYLHVLADALTSVLAIVALTLGAYSGLWFLDPAIGILGGVVILRWSYSLSRQSARQLLDMTPSLELEAKIRAAAEAEEADTRVADLHVWSLGPAGHGCVIRVVTGVTDSAESLRKRIQLAVPLAHLTVEVHRCPEH